MGRGSDPPPLYNKKNMRYDENNPNGLNNLPRIHWPGGRPKDAPAPPTEPAIICELSKQGCEVKMGSNCYEIIHTKSGDVIELLFGCTVEKFLDAVRYLGSRPR